jgi:hypothetical protein
MAITDIHFDNTTGTPGYAQFRTGIRPGLNEPFAGQTLTSTYTTISTPRNGTTGHINWGNLVATDPYSVITGTITAAKVNTGNLTLSGDWELRTRQDPDTLITKFFLRNVDTGARVDFQCGSLDVSLKHDEPKTTLKNSSSDNTPQLELF